jgi:hypothetical protein
MPAGFEIPKGLLALPDGSVLLFAWGFATKTHHCVRGDGRGAWTPVAGPPPEVGDSGVGHGVLPDGRVLLAGGWPGDETGSWLSEPALERWSKGPALPAAASFHKVLHAPNGAHFLSVTGERYRPRVFSLEEGSRWHVAASPESASQFAVAPLSDGRFALVLTEQRDAACLVYDPVARSLKPLPALPQTDGVDAACELGTHAIGSVRRLAANGREFLATLDLSSDAWRAGPVMPEGFTVHALASRGDRVFAFCLERVPGSDFPKREVVVFTASAKALLDN